MFDRRDQGLIATVIWGRTKTASLAAVAASLLAMTPMSAVAAQTTTPNVAAVQNDVLLYRMKNGDNLYKLAQKYMVSLQVVPHIQKLNNISNAHEVPVGSVIRIPLRFLKYRPEVARLVAWRGTVAIGQSATNAAAPTAGMALQEGMAIATGQGGFVTLQLANGSRVSIPSQSIVRIARLREYTINKALDYELAVDKGRLETKATPLKNPASRYRIRTPIAVSAVRGTEFRIKLEDEAKPSLTEVLEGTVAVNAPKKPSEETAVAQGTGLGLRTDGSSAIEKLLPAPELVSPGKVQKDDTLSFVIQPIAGAARYQAVFATDASITDPFAEASSDTPTITHPAIPNGKYFVRISALSPNGFEGYATNYGFARRLSKVSAAAAAPADDGSVTFKWDAGGEGKIVHRFQLYRDTVQSTPVIDEAGLTKSEIKLDTLPPGVWFWRVGISVYGDGAVTDNWTSPEKLIIAREE